MAVGTACGVSPKYIDRFIVLHPDWLQFGIRGFVFFCGIENPFSLFVRLNSETYIAIYKYPNDIIELQEN